MRHQPKNKKNFTYTYTKALFLAFSPYDLQPHTLSPLLALSVCSLSTNHTHILPTQSSATLSISLCICCHTLPLSSFLSSMPKQWMKKCHPLFLPLSVVPFSLHCPAPSALSPPMRARLGPLSLVCACAAAREPDSLSPSSLRGQAREHTISLSLSLLHLYTAQTHTHTLAYTHTRYLSSLALFLCAQGKGSPHPSHTPPLSSLRCSPVNHGAMPAISKKRRTPLLTHLPIPHGHQVTAKRFFFISFIFFYFFFLLHLLNLGTTRKNFHLRNND